MSLLTLTQKLAEPRNQMAQLLYDMIRGKDISEQQYCQNRFRGNISDLRNDYGIPIRHVDVSFVNQFGRKGKFRKHYILTIDREEAIGVYNKINL